MFVLLTTKRGQTVMINTDQVVDGIAMDSGGSKIFMNDGDSANCTQHEFTDDLPTLAALFNIAHWPGMGR